MCGPTASFSTSAAMGKCLRSGRSRAIQARCWWLLAAVMLLTPRRAAALGGGYCRQPGSLNDHDPSFSRLCTESQRTQETLDPFWTEPETCTLPGETFPARGICGGLQGVAVYDLVSQQGSTHVGARLLVFQTPAGKLHATFRTAYPYILNTHSPAAAAQARAPGGGSSKAGGPAAAAAAAHVSLGVWNSRLAAQAAQYRDLVSEPGCYSCVSVTVDLAATCDPLSSVASSKGGCSCGSARCATKSLMDAQMLYLAPSIMLSNASGGADGPAVAFKAYGAAADGVVSYQTPSSCRDGGAAGAAASDDAAGSSSSSTSGGGGGGGLQRQAPVTLELHSGGEPIFSLESCNFLTELLATTANGRRFRSPPSCLADGASLAVTFQMASQADAAAVASKLKQGRDSLASALGMAGRCGARITVSSASISTFDGSNTAALRCAGTAVAGEAGTTTRVGSRAVVAAGGSGSSSGTERQALSGPHVRVSATRATADFTQADCMPLMARIIPAATAEGYTSLQCKASGRSLTGTVSFSSAQQAQQAASAVVGGQAGQALASMASELRVCSGSVVVYYNIKAGGVEEKLAGLSRGPC